MTEDSIDRKRLDRVWRCFDDTGRMQRWPSKRSDQILALWIIWSFIPSGTQYTEMEVNGMLNGWHDINDHAMLRRDLCDLGLMQRTPTGSVYRKVDAEVPPDAAAAIAKFAR